MLPLGPNGYGEYLQPGRVTGCYLGILLDQPLAEIAPEPGRVLVVAPAALRHREIPQPHGRVLYNLVTGHPDRDAAGPGVPGRPHRGAARLAAADLGGGRCQPRGSAAGGGGPLARRPPQGVGAWRGECGGGPRARPPGDGLCARAAPRPAGRGDQPPVPAVAASDQPPPGGRELPVAPRCSRRYGSAVVPGDRATSAQCRKATVRPLRSAGSDHATWAGSPWRAGPDAAASSTDSPSSSLPGRGRLGRPPVMGR
jgi:hypothetical protein